MRLFFRDAQFGEPLQYFVSLDFQLPRQLVDTNLLHRESYLLLTRGDALLATTISRHTLCTRIFGMIVRSTRILYRTKLFHGLRTLARHRSRWFRTRFRGLFHGLF